MSVNVGTVEGTIRLNDQFSGVMANAARSMSHHIGSIVAEAAAFAGVAVTFHAFAHAVMEAEQTTAQLKSVLESTRHAGEEVAEVMEAQARAMARNTTVQDDLLVRAEIVELKFTHIGGEVFPRVTQAALDMAARTGGDVAGAMETLGRSVDDPIRGLSLLRRQGVTFTDEQKALVKQMMSVGNVVGAQGVLLDALAQKYGGAAAAARNTMAGAISALKNSFDELFETMGKDSTGPFRDIVESLVSGLHYLTDNWYALGASVNMVLADIVKKVHSTVNAVYGLEMAVLDAARKTALATGNIAVAAGVGKLERGVRDAKRVNDDYLDSLQQTFSDKAERGIEQQAHQWGLLGKKIEVTGEGLTRLSEEEKAALEALAAALKESAAQAAAMTAGVAALAAGKGVVYAEALVGVMTKFPNASAKTTSALVDLAVKAALAGERFAQLKEFIESAGKGVDLSGLRDVLENLNEGFVKSERTVIETFKDAADDTARQFQTYNDQVDAALQNLAANYASLSLTSKDFFDKQKAEIEGLVAQGLLTYKEGEVALNRATQDFWATQLDAWTSAMDYLGGLFGGVFKVLADVGKGVQQAMQFGKQIQEIATNIARSSGQSSANASSIGAAAGGIASVVAIFAAVYDAVDKWIKKMKSLKYGNAAEFTLVAGREGTTTLNQQAFAVVNGIRDAIHQFEQALRVSITDLSRIGIQIRNDGKYVAAWVEGVMIGHFDNVNDAIRAALTQAITHGQAQIVGLTDLMRQGLEGFTAPDADQFMTFMQQLREIGDLGLGEGVAAMEAFVQHMNELFNVLREMALTPAVAGGMSSVINSVAGSLTNLYNTLTGHKEDIKEAEERQRQAYNAQRAIVMAQLTLMYMEIQARIADVQSRLAQLQVLRDAGIQPGQGGGTGGGGGGGKPTYAKGGGVLVIDVRNPTGDAQMAMLLQILDQLARAMAGLPPEIAPGGVHTRGGGRGGAGGRDPNQLQHLIADQALAHSQIGMTDFAKKLSEVNKKWDEAIKESGLHSGALDRAKKAHDAAIRAANGNADAIKAADAAYQRQIHNINRTTAEIEAANAAREQEIADLKAEQQKAVTETFNQFMGIGQDPLAQLGKTFNDLVKQISEADFPVEQSTRMIADLNAEYERQAAALVAAGRSAAMDPQRAALDAAAGVGSFQRQLLDSQAGLDASREALRKLAKEAAAAGRSTDWLAGDLAKLDAAQAAAAQAIGFDFLGSLQQLGVSLPTDVVLQLAHAQWQLAKAQAINAALALAQAGAFDGLSFTLADLLGWINDANFDLSKFGSGLTPPVRQFNAGLEQASTALSDLARRLVEAQKGIADLLAEMAGGEHGGVSARAALKFQKRRYDETLRLAQGGDIGALESIAGVARELFQTMASFSPQLLAAQLPGMEGELAGLLGLTTAHEGNVLTSTLFAAGQQQVVDATNQGFDATVAVGTEQVQQQAQMNASLTTIANAQGALNDRLALMEAELLVTKRIA